MDKDKLMGFFILITSVIGILVYGWLLFFTQLAILVLKLTAFIVIAILLAILVWLARV